MGRVVNRKRTFGLFACPMSEAQSLQAAHDLIEALKVTKGGASDDEIRNIVTGGITNDRDVLLDALRYQLEHGRFYDASARRALEKVAAMDDHERAAVCAFAAMIIATAHKTHKSRILHSRPAAQSQHQMFPAVTVWA